MSQLLTDDRIRDRPQHVCRMSWPPECFDSYVRWREASAEVRLAYERAETADRLDTGLAFAAFLAALDQEEHAARLHAACADQARAQHTHALH